jgi:hypothetical protein
MAFVSAREPDGFAMFFQLPTDDGLRARPTPRPHRALGIALERGGPGLGDLAGTVGNRRSVTLSDH